MALSLVERVDHPGTLCDHSDKVGLEQRICTRLSYGCLRSCDCEDLTHHFHAGLACIGSDGCSLVVVCDDLCAVVINQVVPAVLVVGCVDGIAVNAVCCACFRDSSCCIVNIFPCPVVCRSLYTVLIKDSLVVKKSDGVVILGKRILMTIGIIKGNNAFIIVVQVDRVVSRNVIIQIQEQIILHVHLSGVGVHPEYIGHLSAGSACLKQCPVVVPVNNVDLSGNAGSSGPLVCDLLQACQLVVIPDIDLKRAACACFCSRSCISGSRARGSAGSAAAACREAENHYACQCK